MRRGRAGSPSPPTTYERLDGLSGYDAGMPSPGFYHAVWESRAGEGGEVGGGREGPDRLAYQGLLERAVGEVRARGQPVSTADLIAVQALAAGLAALRGHEEVWRRDLVDGISGALVKDEVVRGLVHPLLEAVYEVFRGRERGALASGTALPPLVLDIRRRLEALRAAGPAPGADARPGPGFPRRPGAQPGAAPAAGAGHPGLRAPRGHGLRPPG